MILVTQLIGIESKLCKIILNIVKKAVFFMIKYRNRYWYLLENKESITYSISRDKAIVEKAAKSKDTEATGKIVGIGKVL